MKHRGTEAAEDFEWVSLALSGCDTHLIFVIQNAFDSFAQVNDVEIEQQSQRFVRKAEVSE